MVICVVISSSLLILIWYNIIIWHKSYNHFAVINIVSHYITSISSNKSFGEIISTQSNLSVPYSLIQTSLTFPTSNTYSFLNKDTNLITISQFGFHEVSNEVSHHFYHFHFYHFTINHTILPSFVTKEIIIIFGLFLSHTKSSTFVLFTKYFVTNFHHFCALKN